ncbi:hypothetical protein FOA52_006161 [Chlamydomonas sp. UWO 241]|nr:hypothetical protein FOA52_006161 [Chlamydomonas sp. UWO 241]
MPLRQIDVCINPEGLPAAGLPARRGHSVTENYRSAHKLLQSEDVARKLRSLDVSDIGHALPCRQPGLTLAAPPRGTNPLNPTYTLPSYALQHSLPPSPSGAAARGGSASNSAPGSPMGGAAPAALPPYPQARPGCEPGEWRNASPMRTGALDLSDIAGTRARPTLRTRAAPGQYPTGDYGDVTAGAGAAMGDSSRHAVAERMRREGRPTRAPHDAGQLGVFAGAFGGDSGRLIASDRHARAPSNPNAPTYSIHGASLDDARAGVGSFSSPLRARAAAAAGPDRRAWNDAGALCIADAMATGTARHARVFAATSGPSGVPAPRHGLPTLQPATAATAGMQQRSLGRERAAAVQALRAMGNMDKNFGRQSLYDHERHGLVHATLVPTVLRDLEKPQRGTLPRAPEDFLKSGDGATLASRVMLRGLLEQRPVNRDPPLVRGTGGVTLSWGSVPAACSVFRQLYDNGTIDFVALRWGGMANELVWGARDLGSAGKRDWGPRPTDVPVGRWLPVFLEGVREYAEPYRFMSIMGAHDLISEAGPHLHAIAANCVPPLKKALDTREPTVVAVAVELMRTALVADPRVAETWMHYIGQIAQPLNLFLTTQGYSVDMGYLAPRRVCALKDAIQEVLVLLQEHCGFDASQLMRRHMRVDPIVCDASFERRLKQARENPVYKPWQPYTKL